MAHLYILQSKTRNRYYIGSTNDLLSRIKKHNEGAVKTTKGFLPVNLVFAQECETFAQARGLENRLKRYKRKDFIDKIVKDQKIRGS